MDLNQHGDESNWTVKQLRNREILVVDLKPRTALKRKKDYRFTTVLGSEAQQSQSTNKNGSPEKIQKLQDDDSSKNELENNIIKMENKGQDADMGSEEEAKCAKGDIRTHHVGNLDTEVMMMYLPCPESRYEKHLESESLKLKGGGDSILIPRKKTEPPWNHGLHETMGSTSARSKPQNRQDVLVRRSIKEYQRIMAEKTKDVSSSDPLKELYQYPLMKDYKTNIYKTNNISARKYTNVMNTAIKKPIKATNLASSSKGYVRGLCWWCPCAVFLLASLALGLMECVDFKAFFISNKTTKNMANVNFGTNLAALKLKFPSQSETLWKRTNIIVMQHLNMTNPKEPVSLILTSGYGAEKTLGCLAKDLATAFSSSHNAMILSINGTSKAEQDSDQVKLVIDKELKAAFEGGAQAAVIHHFEELPPGSTLIFYRYCDHENAAYKKVLIVFTVMLPVITIKSELSLSDVEERVQEYLKQRFVLSDRAAKFNEMDVDKLSGLWSRISHLILPVTAEQNIEENAC